MTSGRFRRPLRNLVFLQISYQLVILGDPGAASWGDGIFTGESLKQERESPWAFTLTERVPEAFEIPPSDWPENFSGQPTSGVSNASGTRSDNPEGLIPPYFDVSFCIVKSVFYNFIQTIVYDKCNIQFLPCTFCCYNFSYIATFLNNRIRQ